MGSIAEDKPLSCLLSFAGLPSSRWSAHLVNLVAKGL